MGFIIKNNYGPNIENYDGGVVHLHQGNDRLWQTEEVEEVEIVEDMSDVEPEQPQAELNYFAPEINLQNLLKQEWFKELRTKDEYDEAWTDEFIKALMGSEWRDDIAKNWALRGGRKKMDQIKGYVVGLLKDVGVLKGSYDCIAEKVGITEEYRTFSKYMGQGKNQPYAEWVKSYVSTEKSE